MTKQLTPRREEQNVGGCSSDDGMPDGVKACGRLLAPTGYVTTLR